MADDFGSSGMYNLMFYTWLRTNSSFVLVNVTLSNNLAGDAGGALFLTDYAGVNVTCPDASQPGEQAVVACFHALASSILL